MYSSMGQRNADIEAGSVKPAAELAAWLRESADRLAAGPAALSPEQWDAKVVTAQGRTVPATEIPWLRSREACVHAVDLAAGVSFADLPAAFLAALADDIAGKRGGAAGPAVVLTATDTGDHWELPGEGDAVAVTGQLAEITAYLAGRPHALTTPDGSSVPVLPAWPTIAALRVWARWVAVSLIRGVTALCGLWQARRAATAVPIARELGLSHWCSRK